MNEPIKYSLAKQANPQNAEEAPKYYAKLQRSRTIDLNELVNHIIEHGSNFSKGTIVGVITDLVVCMKEALSEGNFVLLGDLGRFSTSISSEGTEKADEFTATNIKELKVNFSVGDGLQAMLDKVKFEPTISRKAQKAALKAQKAGETSADWSSEDGGDDDGTDEGQGGSEGSNPEGGE